VSAGGHFVKSDSTYHATDLGSGRIIRLFIEGIRVSADFADQQIKMEIDTEGGSEPKFIFGDSVRITISNVDLDIDSNNDNGFNLPEQDNEEDQLENDKTKPGKYVPVHLEDTNHNGIPNFADGFDKYGNQRPGAGGEFVPLVLKLSGPVEWGKVKILFDYSDSDPRNVNRVGDGTYCTPYVYSPGAGHLRVWRVDGSANRFADDARSGGDFVRSSVEYSALALGLGPGSETITLFVEGIKVNPNNREIRVEIDYNGDGNYDDRDTVLVNVYKVDFVRYNNSAYGFDPHRDAIVLYKQANVETGLSARVGVSIDGIDAAEIFFTSDELEISVSEHATEIPPPSYITVTGNTEFKDLDTGCIAARFGSRTGYIVNKLSAYSYNERSIPYTYYRVEDGSSPGTQTQGKFSVALLLGDPNLWLRQAVLSFTLDGDDNVVDKAYDFHPMVGGTPTRDGELEMSNQLEENVITAGEAAGDRIFFYVHQMTINPTTGTRATGYSRGPWVFLSDAGNLHTAAHEVGHQWGSDPDVHYWHVPDCDTENLMYRFRSDTKWILHNHPYPPWDNDKQIPGAAQQRQWDEVHQ